MRSNFIAHNLCAPVLAVGVVTLSWAGEASAILVNVSGVSYDVTTFTGDYSSNAAKFNSTDMPWWGDTTKASAFASAVGTQLGLPNTPGQRGPYFAISAPSETVNTQVFFNGLGVVGFGVPTSQGAAYAILVSQSPSSSSVPGPLPLFGAAAAFGWSRRLRSRITVHRPDLPN
jgi:MYXO-CTERM domain-containing protein